MSNDQKKQLQTQLWNIANELRGKMDADEFRDYILGFIFYKYLSEKMQIYADEILEADKIKYQDVDENTDKGSKIIEAIQQEALDGLGYFLKPTDLFHYLASNGATNNNLTAELEKILNNIQNSTLGQDSENDFDSLFSELDLNSQKLGKTVSERSSLISKVITHLDKIDFKLEDSKVDILGDAYEYLIGQFASGAGKKAGEFYTPQEVSTVLARIVTDGKKHLKTVYDPTCGSGSLLLRVAKYVKDVGYFYGQEKNNTTYNLARMNMILHGVHFSHFDIKQDDTLEHPQHIEQKFEAIVANPPFSAKWSADPIYMSDERFSQYGVLPPTKPADYAFILHSLFQLDENGTMAIVMPHGALYRGKSERKLREFIINEKNSLDAVIGLPNNIFFQTDTPTCIMVFKKCRKNSEDILFIDASRDFETVEKQNRLRIVDIDKIMDTYINRKNIDKYSHVATMDEIIQNKYNLSILRYVDTSIQEERIDLNKTVADLANKFDIFNSIDKKLTTECNNLGIPTPIGINMLLNKKFKRGVLQLLFNQKIRFKKSDKNKYTDWDWLKLKDLLVEHKTRNLKNDYSEVFSVAKNKGVINQIEHLGRSYSSKDVSNYKAVFSNDIVYTKSPTSEFPFGIIKQNKLNRTGLVSVLYAVFKPGNSYVGSLLDYYFSLPVNTYNYLIPIINKGAKNTMNINNDDFLDGKSLLFPTDVDEQKRIVEFLELIDMRIKLIEQ